MTTRPSAEPSSAASEQRIASVLDHVLRIDALVRPRNDAMHIDSSDSPMSTAYGARSFGGGGGVPWTHGGPFAASRDTDGDGIPDAFDYHFGPGAHPIGS